MNWSLSKKVTWLLVAVLGLSLLTVGVYAVREQENLALNLMREWVSQCSSRHLDGLSRGLVDSDLDRVAQAGQALIKDMPVAYCEVLDQSGQVVYQEGFRQEDPVAAFVWPVPHRDSKGMLTTVGRLTLVLPPGPMTVAVSRIGQTISVAGLAILCMGLLLGGLAIRSVLGRPMGQLVDDANRVVHGELKHCADVERNDEIGHLARAINTLADELRGSILKDKALASCVDQACDQGTVSGEKGQGPPSRSVSFMKDHVERSGGKFWIESDNGMNPVFHFTLPDARIEAFQEETKGAYK